MSGKVCFRAAMLGTYTKRSTEDVYDTTEGALPVRLQRIAEDDLGETPARRKESLEKLAKLISEEEDLNARTDAEFLLRFLRVRKYNVDEAMQTIRNYYHNRSTCKSVYREFIPSAVPLSARKVCMVPPGKDRQGRPIFLCNIGHWNSREVTHAVFQRACLMCLELMTSDPSAQTLGLVLILDCHDFRVENALSLKPGLIKKGLEYVQDCMPSRLKAFHVVRQTQAFDILYSLMKPFLKNKLTRRFKFHGENFESLHKDISPEELPPEFGGQTPPLDNDAFWSKMDNLEAVFQSDNQYGYTSRDVGGFATQEEVEEALEFI
uniref:Putative phosphatidylinositol transfer protein sec14 midgut overexpressed n=1 Tax=Rhipicephalus microplus TaxID=6941 RepID=A0A6M2CIE3_RHIMP